jgi:hypothetical protein
MKVSLKVKFSVLLCEWDGHYYISTHLTHDAARAKLVEHCRELWPVAYGPGEEAPADDEEMIERYIEFADSFYIIYDNVCLEFDDPNIVEVVKAAA